MDIETFGKMLRRKRKELKISIKSAQVIMKMKAVLSNYENDRYLPTRPNLQKLIEFYQLTPEEVDLIYLNHRSRYPRFKNKEKVFMDDKIQKIIPDIPEPPISKHMMVIKKGEYFEMKIANNMELEDIVKVIECVKNL